MSVNAIARGVDEAAAREPNPLPPLTANSELCGGWQDGGLARRGGVPLRRARRGEALGLVHARALLHARALPRPAGDAAGRGALMSGVGGVRAATFGAGGSVDSGAS